MLRSLFFPRGKSRYGESEIRLKLPPEISLQTIEQLLIAAMKGQEKKQVIELFAFLERRVKSEKLRLDECPSWAFDLVKSALFENPDRTPVITLDIIRRLQAMRVPFGSEEAKALIFSLGEKSVRSFPYLFPRILTLARETNMEMSVETSEKLVDWFLSWFFWTKPSLLLDFARFHCPGTLLIQRLLFDKTLDYIRNRLDYASKAGEGKDVAEAKALRKGTLVFLEFSLEEVNAMRKREMLQNILDNAPFHTLPMVEMYSKFGLVLHRTRPADAIAHARKTGDAATACRMLQVVLDPRVKEGVALTTEYTLATREFSGLVDLLLAHGGYAIPVSATDGSPRLKEVVHSLKKSLVPEKLLPPSIDLPKILSWDLENAYQDPSRVAMVCALQGNLEGAAQCLGEENNISTIYPLLLAAARTTSSDTTPTVLDRLGDCLEGLKFPRILDRSSIDQLTALLASHQNVQLMSQLLRYMKENEIAPVPQTLRDVQACSSDDPQMAKTLWQQCNSQLLKTPEKPVMYLAELGCLQDAWEYFESNPNQVDDRSKFSLSMALTMELTGCKVKRFDPNVVHREIEMETEEEITMTIPRYYLELHDSLFEQVLNEIKSNMLRVEVNLDKEKSHIRILGDDQIVRERALRHIEGFFKDRSLMMPLRLNHAKIPYATETAIDISSVDGALSFVYGADSVHAWGPVYRQHGILARVRKISEKFAAHKELISVSIPEKYRRRLTKCQVRPPPGQRPLINTGLLESTTGTCAQVSSTPGGTLHIFARRGKETPLAAHVNHLHALLGVCPPYPEELVAFKKLDTKPNFGVTVPQPPFANSQQVTKLYLSVKDPIRRSLLFMVDQVVQGVQGRPQLLKDIDSKWLQHMKSQAHDNTSDSALALEFMLRLLPNEPKGCIPALRLAKTADRMVLEINAQACLKKSAKRENGKVPDEFPQSVWFSELDEFLRRLELLGLRIEHEIFTLAMAEEFVERACLNGDLFATEWIVEYVHRRGDELKAHTYNRIEDARRDLIQKLNTQGGDLTNPGTEDDASPPFPDHVIAIIKKMDVGTLGLFLLDRVHAVSVPRLLEAFAHVGDFKGFLFVLSKLSHMDPDASIVLQAVDFSQIFERFSQAYERCGRPGDIYNGIFSILSHLLQQDEVDIPLEVIAQACCSIFVNAGDELEQVARDIVELTRRRSDSAKFEEFRSQLESQIFQEKTQVEST